MIGIYKIENKINGKVYIGQSIDIARRWREHKCSIHKIDAPLYRAMIKYGLENFTFEVLEECKANELDIKEIDYIIEYNSFYNGYNQTTGGESSTCSRVALRISEIKRDLKESKMSSQEIMDKYSICKNSLSMINTGKTYHDDNESYPLRSNKTINHCVDCGKEISYDAIRCRQCYNIHHRLVERPQPNDLITEIATSSFVAVGKKYGVSDKAIVKWCKEYGLPTLKKDIVEYYNTNILKLEKPVAKKKTILKGRILQCDKENHDIIINIYESTYDAARQLGNQNYYKHIGEVCRGVRKSAYGYFWRYE